MPLISNGVEFFEGNFFKLNLDECLMLFETLYLTDKNPDYNNVASLGLSDIEKNSLFSNIYREVLNKFDFLEANFELSKVWLVKSQYEDSDTSRLPYIPHIDYRRFLKVLIYLDDVSSSDGPFHAMPMNPDDNEKFRLSLKSDYKKKQANRIDFASIDRYVEYAAPAGSVLAFDTNCPHFAGSVMECGKRRVIRFDFSCPSWERSKVIRFKKMIARMLNY
jgi:hypothetical protein